MTEPFRFPEEMVAQGLAACSTMKEAQEFAHTIAMLEALATFLMAPDPPPRPPRRRWWRR